MAPRRSSGLSAGQLVAAVFGFLIASFLVFVFGMWVGKDVAERRLAQEERVVRGPVAQITPQEQARDPDITFYEHLRQQTQQSEIVSPGAALPTATSTIGATRAIPVSHPTETQGIPTPRHTLVRTVPTPRPPRDEWADAGWTVQVSATTDPNDATSLVARLRVKGFDAYTIRAPMRGQTWYRVRVGHFATRDEAKQMEHRLKSLEGLANSYITPR